MTNMTLDTTKPAKVATQCRHPDGLIGSFLYQGSIYEPSGTSPRFADLVGLFAWCRDDRGNGWGGWAHKPGDGGTYHHRSAGEV